MQTDRGTARYTLLLLDCIQALSPQISTVCTIWKQETGMMSITTNVRSRLVLNK